MVSVDLVFWVLVYGIWGHVWFALTSAVSLNNCGGESDDKFAEILRNGSTSTFTCTGLGSVNSVIWFATRNPASSPSTDSTNWIIVGDCTKPNSCQDRYGGSFTPSWTPSSTASDVLVKKGSLTNTGIFESYDLICYVVDSNRDSCPMDYVTPAVGTCSAQFDTTMTPWGVSIKCNVTQAQSTRDRYSCRVLQKQGTSPETEVKSWQTLTPPSSLPALPANPAHCNTKLTWPTVDGRYTYRVQLRPGRNNFVNVQFQGDNEIRNPVSPSIGGCGGSDVYLAENSRVQCTCTTTNIGKPPGRLVWRETGDVGDTSVQMMSSPLLRGNYTFTCLVAWATNNTVSSVTVKVGYKPEALSIKIGSTLDEEVTVSENDPVTLTCQADARPVATLTITRQGEGQVTSGQSPLSHVVERARCEDTGQYVCSATNSLGQADNTVTKTLLVACSPRRTKTDLGALNFMNQTASLSFDVISFPSPSSTFTFMYTGVSGTDSPVQVKDIELLAKCYVRSEVNQFQCNVIVLNMTSPQAAGFYTVNVTNDRGGQLYTFQLLYNAATTDEQCQCSDCPPSYLSVAVGLAVVLGLVVTANIVVAVWLWRRAWAMPCAGHEVITNKETTSQTEPADDDDITLPSASGVPQESGPYDSLRMSEVGLRSQYSVIHHKHPRSTGSTIYEGTTEYENQRP